MTTTHKGNLYIIAAPSGTGKTTLVKALIKKAPNLMVSISHTTRLRRDNEIEGISYFFVDRNTFENMITQGEFLEYATIFDHLYGTTRAFVESKLREGLDIILEIDWQGYQQIKQIFPSSIGIFILPPSWEVLKKRLVTRCQDHPEIIATRLKDAKETISHIDEFDYIVINDAFDQALQDLQTILLATKLQQSHQLTKYSQLISNFKKL